MQEPTIECPNCGTEIKLTDSLAGPLIEATRTEYEAKLNKQKQSLETERKKISEEERQKASAAVALEIEGKTKELSALEDVVKKNNEKLAEAQAAQAEMLKKERTLEDARRELDLTVEKRVQQTISEVREKTKAEIEGELKLKVTEKEEQILSMQRQIEELRRKSEQGSQQLQGEVLELELEQALTEKFPLDSIEPVPKGEFGGDVVHKVFEPPPVYRRLIASY